MLALSISTLYQNLISLTWIFRGLYEKSCCMYRIWQKISDLCHPWRVTELQMWSFSAVVWLCPCLSICLPWLSLSVYPVGCVCLPDSVTFLSFSQCLFLPRLVSLTAPFKLLLLSLYAVSPSLLSLFLLFWHHHFVPSELVSAFNPIWINIHYTFHRVLCNKRLHSACHSESRKQYVPFPKVRTDLNSPP